MTSAVVFSSSSAIFSIRRRSVFDPPFRSPFLRNSSRRIRSRLAPQNQSFVFFFLSSFRLLFVSLLLFFLKDFEAKNLKQRRVVFKHIAPKRIKERDFSEKDRDRQTHTEREREKRKEGSVFKSEQCYALLPERAREYHTREPFLYLTLNERQKSFSSSRLSILSKINV